MALKIMPKKSIMVSNDTAILNEGGAMQASYDDICKILHDMREALSNGRFEPISRRKNIDTLTRLGIMWDEVKDVLIALTPADYRSGPMMDRDRPASDELWVFKSKLEGETIYIKFKVLYQEDGRVRVLSFHIDEF